MNKDQYKSESLFNSENIQILKKLVKSYPNDSELGFQVRKLFANETIVKSLGHDATLGKEIRKILINFSK